MREVDRPEEILTVCKALNSPLRLQILTLLQKNRQMNLGELAEQLQVTNGAMTAHIRLLYEAGMIDIQQTSGRRGAQKTCTLRESKFMLLAAGQPSPANQYETEIPIGNFVDYSIEPTCGLATAQQLIGELDDPRSFDSPLRTQAGILWFSRGYLEYHIPNLLRPPQNPVELQILAELSSEAPGVCEDWPSDIAFSLNGHRLGCWTSPGDFGGRHGAYTPEWWPAAWNQYGLLKLITVNREGSFVDGRRISDVTIGQLDLGRNRITLRLETQDSPRRAGGLTLFGRQFGNYAQDIRVRLTFEEQQT